MEGNPCTVLSDALGVKPMGNRWSSGDFYLSLYAEGWASPRPEVRTHFAQIFDPGEARALFRVYGTGEVCGFDTRVGKGRAILIAAAYNCDIPLFRTALENLMTSTATEGGGAFSSHRQP